VSRQFFGRDAAQRIEIARLRGEEFAGEAELAVHHRQPLFQPGGFVREQARGIAKPARGAAAVAQEHLADEAEQQHRHRPVDQQGNPLLRRDSIERPQVRPAIEGRPADQHQRDEDRAEPATGGALNRFILPIEHRLFHLLDRCLRSGGGGLFSGGLIGLATDGEYA